VAAKSKQKPILLENTYEVEMRSWFQRGALSFLKMGFFFVLCGQGFLTIWVATGTATSWDRRMMCCSYEGLQVGVRRIKK
jgi:hypothetical protein